MEIKAENLLSVRGEYPFLTNIDEIIIVCFKTKILVGRVVSREVDVSSFTSTEEYNQFFSDFSSFDISLPDHYKEKWILVPNSYFLIYLGESFSFYLNFINDSIQEVMTDVTIRIDIQTGNRATFLKEFNLENLDAKSSIDTVLSHEVKEPCTHV